MSDSAKNNLLSLDPSLQAQIQEIKDLLAPHTKRIYLVGGIVRDLLRGETNPKDTDIEIYDIDERRFDALMQRLGAKSVGKKFFVYKYKDLDLALARKETKVANKHNGFRVEIEKSEEIACARRDFRMNAVMIHLFSNELVDIYDGARDIKLQQISIIQEDRFIEDSLRVLRAVQFSARFGYKIAQSSLAIMQNIDLDNISKSRIFDEFEKLFNAKYLHFGWHYLVKLGVLEKLFGIRVTCEQYIKIFKILKKYSSHFDKTKYHYYFLYILSTQLGVRKKLFGSKVFSGEYIKNIRKQKKIPRKITHTFLFALSLKHPLKNWLGSYRQDIANEAKKLDVYEESYKPKESIQGIIAQGYEKVEIKKEYLKRAYLEIKGNKSPIANLHTSTYTRQTKH